MTREEIIRMAREAGLQHREAAEELYSPHCDGIYLDDLERFASLVSAAEREACAEEAGKFARKWWSLHCASNRHMETTLRGHADFCALQVAIRARGQE